MSIPFEGDPTRNRKEVPSPMPMGQVIDSLFDRGSIVVGEAPVSPAADALILSPRGAVVYFDLQLDVTSTVSAVLSSGAEVHPVQELADFVKQVPNDVALTIIGACVLGVGPEGDEIVLRGQPLEQFAPGETASTRHRRFYDSLDTASSRERSGALNLQDFAPPHAWMLRPAVALVALKHLLKIS